MDHYKEYSQMQQQKRQKVEASKVRSLSRKPPRVVAADTAAAMQREEKQLEASLNALLSQVADLKNSLGSFIYKLENEYDRLTWPSVLDSFALLSGQLNTLNQDRDEDLMRQTEGRVPVFSHEVVPDHLRTKPDPEVEEQEKQLTTDAARIGADVA
uniref:Mediator of RNA polymerase II transcription subunit 8 n=1 Tax=Myotis myotis TaxID=51298 RepID=A0A7J7S218_MYOMY|nr:hypothetical protein mMyoMyo1_010087 [Myotis myotis]